MNNQEFLNDFRRYFTQQQSLVFVPVWSKAGLDVSPEKDHPIYSSQSGKTVRATRRRPSGQTSGQPRERAEAPSRERPSGTGLTGGGSSGGGRQTYSGGGGSMGRLPKSPLLIGIIVLVAICIGVFQLLNGGSIDLGGQEPIAEEPLAPAVVENPTPRPTRTPGAAASTGGSGETWTVMLYQDADDKVLEQDIFVDLNEAEKVGSSDQVKIVAQMDRYRAGFSGDGNWTSAKRFLVLPDDDLTRIGSEMVEDLGEINMADGQTLVDFVRWAVENYPADRYALILSDHGLGWPGGWSDPTSSGGAMAGLPMSSSLDDQLYLNELDAALEAIRNETGLEKFELIGMDACLMAHLEVYGMLAQHARYAVASQETEPSLGWAYAAFLEELQADPGMDGAELSRAIVDSYIRSDERILDDQARSELYRQGSPSVSLFGPIGAPSAEQVTQQLYQGVTLSAVDLSQMAGLMSAFNDFSFVLQDVDPRYVAQARSYARSYTSIFGKDVPPSYIDLGNFVQLAARSGGQRSLAEPAQRILDGINQAVIAEVHGSQKAGSTGISIYYPNSQLYKSTIAGAESYTAAASWFSTNSLWDEFLEFHYTGRAFEADAVGPAVPSSAGAVRAPAAGGIDISDLTASAQTAAPGRPVLLSAEVQGENIGYIKLLVGFLDTSANSIYVADSDYLESAQTLEVDGVYYPDWGSEDFTLEFEWEPIVFGISDGSNTAVALLTPETYGASAEEAIYSVEGVYQFADGGERLQARLYFRNGQLQQVFGFSGDASTGAPREIIPQVGDTFTILERWLDMDNQGNVTGVARQEGDTLTFGEQMFTWQELDAAAGGYIVGFIVEDLDGNSTAAYTQIQVR